MRSDFLDRAAEDRRFVEELTRGLVFLQSPSRGGLEESLTQPLDMVGYSFESGVVHAMLESLDATPGALPLLQFTAAKLWEARDRQRRILPRDAYLGMGGVAGALATHADEVLSGLSAPDQKVVRAIFQRLVTPERTRAIVDGSELRDIGPDVDRLVAHLVSARLLVVQTRGDGAGAVEIVHESLIKSWPQLGRWLDENQEDVAYLAQIRAAAKQWDAKGRPEGLLWRNEAMEEARLWRHRYLGELPQRESEFIDAVIALGTRAARVRRRAVMGAFAFLLVLVAAAGATLFKITDQNSRLEASKLEADDAKDKAIEAAAAVSKQKELVDIALKQAEAALAAEKAAVAAEQIATSKVTTAEGNVAREALAAKNAAALAETQRQLAVKEKAIAAKAIEDKKEA
jgi:hypothetical protein